MKWTLPGVRRLREAVERGETDEQIAARLGLTRSGITQARHRYGIPSVPRRPSRVDRAVLRTMIESGATDAACAKKLGVSEQTIRVQRRAMGIVYDGPVVSWRGAKPLSTDQIDAIRLAAACGWSEKRIMRELHIGPARLKRILEQA